MMKFLYSLSLLFITQIVFAQSFIPGITQYTTKEGLLSDKIYALHKDTRGFIWLGTEEGLNRFDGEKFRAYTPDNMPGMTIRSVHEIFEDANGLLWLLKKNEIYDHQYKSPEIVLFNIYTEEFISPETYFGEDLPFKVGDIRYMKMLEDGQIYMYFPDIKQGFSYSVAEGFQSFSIPEEVFVLDDLKLLNDGNFLLKGMVHTLPVKWNIFKCSRKGEVLNQSKANLYLPLQKDGTEILAKFESINFIEGGFNLDAYNYFDPNLSASNQYEGRPFEFIDQADWNQQQELFWLKSHNQLRVIQPDGKIVFEHKVTTSGDQMPILFDGNITWWSNAKDGLMAFHLQPNYFSNYEFFEKGFDNSTRGIHQDRSGKTWVSTIAGYSAIDANGMPSKDIKRSQVFTRYMQDEENNLWYVDEVGLIKHNLATNQKTTYPIQNGLFASWSLLKPAPNEVWVAQFNGKIFKVNTQSGEVSIKTVLPSNTHIGFNIYEYLEKDDNSFWLCTNQGLYVVNKEGEFISMYNQEQEGKHYLPTRAVHHMYIDNNKTYWLATGDAGLLKLNMGAHGLVFEKEFNMSHGLSSNALHAVYEDDHEYLWISSDNGLMQFDKRTEQVYRYFEEDGLPHNEFNRIAHFKAADGQLFFGGLMGVTSFQPKHFAAVRNAKNNAPLSIIAFEQFSSEKEKFEDLTTQLSQSNTITLHPEDQFFNLKVRLLDYQQEEEVVYNYRVKGLYDWQSNASGDFSISGLPYGNHQLEIKAVSGNHQEASNMLNIEVVVLRPFYLQWWFLLGALLMGALIIWFFVKRRTSRLLLQQEAAQLKSLDQMKSRFFTNIAHEFRTPLTLIGLPLEYVLNNLGQFSEEEIRKHLQAAFKNQQDLNQMVDEILSLSKMESGKLKVLNKTIFLNDYLELLIDTFKTSAKSKGIQFRYSSFIPTKMKIETDPTKLEMIIKNLLSNALKFTPTNGKITVSADWQATEGLIFKVQDNGRGIHPEDLPYIFDRYYQSNQKAFAMDGGSGIGLAICKEMLTILGGRIQADSTLEENTDDGEQGSTFIFKLPMAISKESVISPEISPEIKSAIFSKQNSNTASEGKLKVLIVEDHPELQNHLQNILNPHYDILLASNGVEGLNILENEREVNLIISDVMMPEMDGFTFLEKVKKEDRFCGIPFMLLTARTTIQDKLHGLRIGVDAYMTKPFVIEELLLRVDKLLFNANNRGGTTTLAEDELLSDVVNEKNGNQQKPQPEPILKRDLEWLKKVEGIALREIKNPAYSVEHLAKELLMSRRQVFRKIKSITGITPKKYINAVRLQKAKYILESQEVNTLKEVCYAIGFENVTHFANLFQKEFGIRPHDLLSKSMV